jgi:nucleotide-binding universal stress UspA family protein
MKTIVVATDGSPSAAAAVAFGVELAAEAGGTVHFVYVVPAVPARAFPMVSVPHELAQPDDTPLVGALRYAATQAVPAEGKLRGTFASALLGSTSRGVIGEARRPVLVVHGDAVATLRAALSAGAGPT